MQADGPPASCRLRPIFQSFCSDPMHCLSEHHACGHRSNGGAEKADGPACKKMKGAPGLSTLCASAKNLGKSGRVCNDWRQTTASTLLLACSQCKDSA